MKKFGGAGRLRRFANKGYVLTFCLIAQTVLLTHPLQTFQRRLSDKLTNIVSIINFTAQHAPYSLHALTKFLMSTLTGIHRKQLSHTTKRKTFDKR